MGRKPAYYNELDSRLTQIEANQVSQMGALQEIHFLLDGTKYEKKTDGGMVGDMAKLKKKVHNNTVWRIRITAAGAAVVGTFGFIVIKFTAMVKSVKELLLLE